MNDLNSIIEAQKEQISRYQSRLKDVVAAYKSLLKEKEALDVSLAALSSEPSSDGASSENPEKSNQLNAIMRSMALISQEKSRMEASFQAEKKSARQELSSKIQEIKKLNDELKNATVELVQERENYKAKFLIYDRILSDERHLKENLETQLNQLKTAFSQTSNSDKVIRELNATSTELSEVRKKLKSYESNQSRMHDDTNILQSLQVEMENLKQQHTTNLMMEKQRANEANEKSRKLTQLHEEGVQSLEARLSELSASVAHYHNLRESDQKSISQLKEKISQLNQSSDTQVSESTHNFPNIQTIIEEIERLKHLLIYENTKLNLPLDLSAVLSSGDETVVSAEKYSTVKQECKKLRNENGQMKLQICDQLKHIKTLQEKVQVLNKNIDDYENELKTKSLEVGNELKAERNKWKQTISQLEIEYRSKTSQLEQQLQKQRERSLSLLEEKENEIRTLKTSYELFIPKKLTNDEDDGQRSDSSGTRKTSVSQLGVVLNQAPNSSSNLPETHMIYYSNELARKEMELSTLRKAKREADSLIRQTLKEKIMIQEELDDKICNLEQQVDRLERSKSRTNGANLEYLKNVTLGYLTTNDPQSKKKMLNAISAVLKFDDSEVLLINNHLGRKK